MEGFKTGLSNEKVIVQTRIESGQVPFLVYIISYVFLPLIIFGGIVYSLILNCHFLQPLDQLLHTNTAKACTVLAKNLLQPKRFDTSKETRNTAKSKPSIIRVSTTPSPQSISDNQKNYIDALQKHLSINQSEGIFTLHNLAGESERVVIVDERGVVTTKSLSELMSLLSQEWYNIDYDNQKLSLTDNTLSISGGNSIRLPTNSQTLSINGNTLSISDGNSITLPGSTTTSAGTDNWGTQTVVTNLSLSGNGTTTSPLGLSAQSANIGQVLKWNGTSWVPANDIDTDTNSGGTVTSITTGAGLVPVNIINSGQIALDTSSISGCTGATTDKLLWDSLNLRLTCATDQNTGIGGGDNWGTQVASVNVTLAGDGTTGNPLRIAQQGAALNQVLKWNGTSWAPANDIDTDTDTDTNNYVTSAAFSGTTTKILTIGRNALSNIVASFNDIGFDNPLTTSGDLMYGGSAGTPTRLPGATTNGYTLKYNTSTNTPYWAPDIDTDTNSGGTVTSVASGNGLTGGPINSSGTLSLNTSSIGSCTGGSDKIIWDSVNNRLTCGIDYGGTGSDNWGTQVVQKNSTLIGDGTSINVLGLNLSNTNTWSALQTFNNGVAVNNGLTVNGGLTIASGTVNLPAGSIANSALANSGVTVNVGSGLAGGGIVSLGGTVSLTNMGILSISGTAPISITAGQNPTISCPTCVTTSNIGTNAVTAVTAGNGLTGGGTSGAVTLDIGAGTGITVGADTVSVNMSAFTTDNLAEGTTNLYWTLARFNSAFASKSTTDLAEGTNLYFSDERVDDRVAALIQNGTGISWTYNDIGNSLTAAVNLGSFTTDNLAEGTTNLYWTQTRFNTAFSGKSTSDLTEGTNLYFTNTRARTAISTTEPLTYNSGTGVLGIIQATTSTNGYLSSTDWNTFNSKENVLTFSSGLTRTGNSITSDLGTSIDTSEIVNNTIVFADWASNGCLNGEIPKYNGSAWVCASDTVGSGTVTGAGTATQVAFWNGASSLTSNANLYWDNTNSRLGIGTNVPTTTLELSNSISQNNIVLKETSPTRQYQSLAFNFNDGTYNEIYEILGYKGTGMLFKIPSSRNFNFTINAVSKLNILDNLISTPNNLLISKFTANSTIQINGGDSSAGYNGDFSINVGGSSKELSLYNNLSNRHALFIVGGNGVNNTYVGINTTTPGSLLTVRGTTSDNTKSVFGAQDLTGNYLLYVRNDGNVGIGNSSPASALSIGASGQFQVNGTNGAVTINNGPVLSNGLGSSLTVTSSGLNLTGVAGSDFQINHTPPAGYRTIFGLGNRAFAILTTGNSSFSVENSAATTNPMYIKGAVSQTADYLQIRSSAATSGDVFVVDANGNLGLGNATPGYKMDVTGSLRATGTINFSGLTGSKVVFTDGSKNLTSTGTVGADQGGTGQSTYTTGDLLYASGATTLSKLAATTNGYVLTLAGGVPTWAASGVCATCFVQSGNSFGVDAVIGTNDNNGLTLETNNTVRMNISNTGLVSIYGGSPGVQLFVDGSISSPGALGSSEHFGESSVASQSYDHAFGYNAYATGSFSSAFGANTVASANSASVYGAFASATGTNSLAIGTYTQANFNNSYAIGSYINTTATNQMVIGNGVYGIDPRDFYLGMGVTNADANSAGGIVVNATGGSGTDVAGADFAIAGGKGTGSAVGGSLIFKTSSTGVSGSTLNSLVTRMSIDSAGNINIPGLSASSGIYTDGSKNLTTTAPTSGVLGYWSRTGTSLKPATSGDSISVPGSGTDSEKFGKSSIAGGIESSAFGANADATAPRSSVFGAYTRAGSYSVAVGRYSVSDGTFATSVGNFSQSPNDYGSAFGHNAGALGIGGTALGSYTSVTANYSIALGYNAHVSDANTMVIGSDTFAENIHNIYFNGITSSAPSGTILQGAGGSGTNIAGASLSFAGGQGTGTGVGGDLIFKTAPAGVTGSALNSLVERMRITPDGNVGIGNSVPAYKLEVKATAVGRLAQFQNTASHAEIALNSAAGSNGGYIFSENGTDRMGLIYNKLFNSGGRLASTFELYSYASTSPIMRVHESAGLSFVIDASGNVGIGSSNPTAKLDVLSNLTTTTSGTNYGEKLTLTHSGATTGTDTLYGDYNSITRSGATAGTLLNYGSYNTLSGTFASGTGTLTNYGGYFSVSGDTVGTSTSIGLYATASGSDTNYAAIFDQGFVGIGTSSPTDKLMIQGGGLRFNSSGNAIDFASASDGNIFTMKVPRKATTGTCASAANEGLKIHNNGGTQVGHICIDGPTSATPNKLRFYAEQFNATSTDLAENYSDHSNSLQAGDVVSVDPNYVKSAIIAGSENSILGVVSTSPGLLLTDIDESGASTEMVNPKPIALAGRVPVKVNAEGGSIKPGDYLTLSSQTGVATKANRAGYMIGIALEAWSPNSGKNTVLINVNNDYADPQNKLSQLTFNQNGDLIIQSYEQSLASLSSQSAAQESALNTLMINVQSVQSTQSTELNDQSSQLIDVKTKIQEFSTQLASISAQITGLNNWKSTTNLDLQFIKDEISYLKTINNSSNSSSSALLDSQIATLEALTVSDKANINDLGVTGNIIAGLVTIDGVSAEINTLNKPLKIQSLGLGSVDFLNGKVTIEQKGTVTINNGQVKGNDSFRGKVVLKAGQTEIQVNKTWETAPESINLTTTFNGKAWIEQVDTTGFTIKVDTVQSNDKDIYWMALW